MEWILFYGERPWTLNAERTWHHHKRAKYVKEWRDAFCEEATKLNIPKLDIISIEAMPILPTRRLQDCANCFPAVKAAIDGLVDAEVIEDDNPNFISSIKFYSPEYVKGVAGLYIKVIV